MTGTRRPPGVGKVTTNDWWPGPDQRRPGQLLGLPAPGRPWPRSWRRTRPGRRCRGERWRRTPTTPSPCCGRWPEHADREPASIRWSFVRHWGDARLIMIDSRAGRVLDEQRAPHGGRRGVRLDRGRDAPGGRGGGAAPDHRHIAALAAVHARSTTSSGGTRRSTCGTTAGGAGGWPRRCARPPTWSTGRRSGTPSSGSVPALTSVARGEHGRAPATRAGPLRRRPPRLRRRARPPGGPDRAGAPADRVAAAQPGAAPDPGGLPDRLEPARRRRFTGAAGAAGEGASRAALRVGEAGRPVLRQPDRRARARPAGRRGSCCR